MQVVNSSNYSVSIEIILASGAKDSINLQAKSRANLPIGSKINPDREKQYASFLKTDRAIALPVSSQPTENFIPKQDGKETISTTK